MFKIHYVPFLMCSFALTPMPVFAQSQDSERESKTSEKTQENREKDIITVYGRHNKLVTHSKLATKSNMSLLETPAAIVVVDEKLINSQAATDVQDLLRNVSGLNQAGNNYGIGDNLAIRGLGANYTFDGMYGGAGLGNTFNPTRSLTNVESVEVLKGPATGLYGIGSAGGIINLVEKKPQFEPYHAISGTIGQWNTYNLTLDLTSPITDKLAYRVVAATQNSDGYRDVGKERNEVYASLRYLLNESNEFLLSGAYIKDSVQIDSVGDPIRIFNSASVGGKTAGEVTWKDLVNDPSKKGLQLSEDQRKQLAGSLRPDDGVLPFNLGKGNLISPISRPNEGEEFRIKLHYTTRFGERAELVQQLQFRDYKTKFIRQTGAFNYVYWKRQGVINRPPRSPVLADGKLYPFSARRQEYRKIHAEERSWQYFADLRVNWSLRGIENEFLLNANLEDRDIKLTQWSIYDKDTGGTVPYIFDIRNPNWGTGRFEDYKPRLRRDYKKKVRAMGIGVQNVTYLTDRITTRLGGAFSKVKQTYQNLARNQRGLAQPQYDTDDKGFTYNLGASYRPFDNLAVFVNYAKGQTAYSILGTVGAKDNRPNSESKTAELGFRFKTSNDQFLASLVFFESKRTNLRYSNPDYDDNPQSPDYNISVPQYFYNGEDRTKGVELDLNARLGENWLLNINGTLQDPRNRQNPNSTSFNRKQKGVPEHAASAWLIYTYDRLPLPNPLEFSLGVNYVGERSTNSSSFGIPDGHVPAYTVWDAGIDYTAENYSISLVIKNIFDEHYYSKAMFLGGMPGESRNVELRLRYTF